MRFAFFQYKSVIITEVSIGFTQPQEGELFYKKNNTKIQF